MNDPVVSIIIVNWNGAQYLRACLTALCQQTYAPLEIIIIDNASTDHSCQVIEEFIATMKALLPETETFLQFPNIRFIRNKNNVGFCRGNNQGITISRGEFVMLLNADVTLDRQFIANLVTLMHADPNIGIALGKLLNGIETTKIDSTGIVIYKNRRAVDRGQGEFDTGQYDTTEEVFGASGAACLYRRIMLEESKYSHETSSTDQSEAISSSQDDEYLDELFFAYKEDVDLSWRARLFGWKCVYTPEAVGQHYRTWGTGKRKQIPKRVRRHSLKNRYLMMLKNERWNTFSLHLFPILWYEFRSLGYILLREPYLFSVIVDIIRTWSSIMKKRATIHQRTSYKNVAVNLSTWFQ